MSDEEILDALVQAIDSAAEPSWTETLTAIGLVFAALGLIFTAFQFYLSRKSLDADHDRSRRQTVSDILQFYLTNTQPEHNKIVQLLDAIDNNTIKKLRDGEPITLGGKEKEFACSALRSNFPDIYDRYCADDREKRFSHAETMQLRYVMLQVLNHYEICLSPWLYGIADEQAMENQFRALVDERDGQHKLEKVRSIIGKDKFPATEAFKAKLFPATPPEKKGRVI